MCLIRQTCGTSVRAYAATSCREKNRCGAIVCHSNGSRACVGATGADIGIPLLLKVRNPLLALGTTLAESGKDALDPNCTALFASVPISRAPDLPRNCESMQFTIQGYGYWQCRKNVPSWLDILYRPAGRAAALQNSDCFHGRPGLNAHYRLYCTTEWRTWPR